jgi:hypothetical protein
MGNPKTQAPLDTRHKTLFPLSGILKTLEKTEGTIMNGQLRDSGIIGHKTQNEDKQHKAKTQQNTENTYLLFIYIQICKRM